MYFCEGLKNATTDDDKFALTTQVINVAMEMKGNPCFSLRILRFWPRVSLFIFWEAHFGFDFILGVKLIFSYFFLDVSFLDSGVVIERFSNDYRKTKTKAISRNLLKKTNDVSIKTKSPPTSLSFKGQATKHRTVKWPIGIVRIHHFLEPTRKPKTKQSRDYFGRSFEKRSTHCFRWWCCFSEGALAITCRIPRPAAQKLIREICVKKEWDKLHMLFLGGDSQRLYQKGRGGVATGCDAVIVPLDQLLTSSVKDRDKLIAVLLDHGAQPNGPLGCKTPPLSVAMEMEDYAIACMLLKHGADASAIGCYRGTGQHQREVIIFLCRTSLCGN